MSSAVEQSPGLRAALARGARVPLPFAALTAVTVVLLASLPFVLAPPLVRAREVIGYLASVLFVVAGLIAHRRRPGTRTGTLLVGVATAWVGEVLAIAVPPVLFTLGQVLTMVTTPMLIHLALAFPEGRLPTRGTRRLVVLAWVVCLAIPAAGVPFKGFEPGRFSWVNLLLWRDVSWVTDVVSLIGQVAQTVVASVAVYLMVRRTVLASPLLRRVLLPGYVLGWALGAVAVVDTAAVSAGLRPLHLLTTRYLIPVVFLLLPLGYLLGVFRMTWSTASVPVVARLGPDTTVSDLAARLRVAAGDPTLDLVVGSPVAAYEPTRATTPVTVEGTTVGAVVHDPALLESPDRLAVLTQAAAWGLQAIALRDGLGSRLETVEEVAARLAEASDSARHRLERDLHDGAQQQLLTVALQLSLLQDELSGLAVSDAAARLAAVTTSLDEALADLRSLARGMPPRLLATAGLGPALRDLAARTSPPVDAQVADTLDLPAGVEGTLYFAAAEALANVTRHARASSASLRLESGLGWVRLSVDDDGVGAADPLGSGLAGIRARAISCGGSLAVGDRPGGGTSFVLTVPLTAHE